MKKIGRLICAAIVAALAIEAAIILYAYATYTPPTTDIEAVGVLRGDVNPK